MIPLLIIGLVALVIAVVWIAIVAGHRSRERMLAAWETYAAPRGMRVVRQHGPWHHRQADRIEGTRDGVELTIALYVVHTGKSSIVYTRASAPAPTLDTGKLKLVREGFFSRLIQRLGYELQVTGDSEFDSRYRVRTNRPDWLRTLLTKEVRAAVLAFPRKPIFEIAKSTVMVTWHAAETDPEVLESAARIVVSAARAAASTPERMASAPLPKRL